MKHIMLIVVSLLVVGCAYTPSTYSPSAYNVKAIEASGIRAVNLLPFESAREDEGSLTCRAAGPITPPNEMSYVEYIEQAFRRELELADVLSESGVAIKGQLESIDFSSMGADARWNIEMSFRNDRGDSARVESSYGFDTSFIADKACQRVAQNFSGAVEQLVRDTVEDPGFLSLLEE